MLESRGMLAERIDELDKHSPQWRRIYFLRRLASTLREIDDALDELRWTSGFQSLLAKRSKADQEEVSEARMRLTNAKKVVKALRDKLSGHIDPQEVQKGLERLEPGRFSFIEAGLTLEKTHYKFAGEIVAAMMSADTDSAEQQLEMLETDFEKIGQAVSVVGIVDKIVMWYAEDRHLI